MRTDSMHPKLGFLQRFPKSREGLYYVYDLYSFDNFFRLLLKNGLDFEEALSFILSNSSLSAIVFQERIHDKGYVRLSAIDALSPKAASVKMRLIHDLLDV
jgi:hypothetical protein